MVSWRASSTDASPHPKRHTQVPSADAATIKRAYYGCVKECHPDLSMDEDSTEFCKLVNEIYEVRWGLAGC
jgi:DnaJ-domain-containing protein 1